MNGQYTNWVKYSKSEKGRSAIKKYRQSPTGRFAVWQSQLRKLYNIWAIEWAYIFSEQGYCCAVCKSPTPKTNKWWCTHHTGSKKDGTLKVHAILCHECNVEAKQGTKEHIAHLRTLANKLEEWL